MYWAPTMCRAIWIIIRKTKRWKTVAASHPNSWALERRFIITSEGALSFVNLLCGLSLDSVSYCKCIQNFFLLPIKFIRVSFCYNQNLIGTVAYCPITDLVSFMLSLCVLFSISLLIQFFIYFRKKEEGKEKHQFDVPLFVHSLIVSCMCPDQGLNPQPWHIKTTL